MKSGVSSLLTLLLACGFDCASVFGQATAQISGRVTDQSAAVLPGVEVTATQTATGVGRTALSDEAGSFVLPNLPIGPYRLEAALPGFRTFVQTGIVLQVSSNAVINAVLQVGQVTEQVEVQANSAMVETRTTSVGQVMENERILELPLNGRQVSDLIALSGAAVSVPLAASNRDRAMPGSVSLSVAGGISTGTVYLLDGAMHNDPFNNLNLPLPFPDALQEFKVETSALTAQSGMYSGASVNSVTKSGTNEFHGSLFEFVRNDLFNARNYFATTNSTLKRNQFGGVLGGPVISNRLFFFAGYQGTTVRQDPADILAFVPTAAMLAGDFTTAASAACNTAGALSLRPPFVDNRIDPARYSRAALNLAAKLPTTPDPCGRVTYGVRNVTDEHQILGRTDYQLSGNHTLFGRYMISSFDQPPPYSIDSNLLNTVTPGFDNLAQSYAFGSTLLLGPSAVNSYRLAVNRTAINRIPGEFFSAPDIGVNMYSFTPIQTKVVVTGGFSIGANFGPNRTTTYQMSDDVSLIRGPHQMAIGTNIAHWRNNLNAIVFSPGNFSFNGQVTGIGLADFLTGNTSQLMQSTNNRTYMSQWYFGVYGTDTWRATPRLTLNYGVRWEPWFPQLKRDGIVATFSEERYGQGARSSVFKNAPAGFQYPGDPGFPGADCEPGAACRASGMNKKLANVAPRVGLAWDPKGDGRTSVRASYGLSFDMLTGGFFNTFISPPWNNSIIVAFPPGGFDDPWQGYPGGNPFPGKPVDADALFVPFGNYFVIAEDNPSTQKHSWNLSIQRQIASEWLSSVSYIGSQTAHVWFAQELNPAIYLPGGPCTLQGASSNPCSTAANRNVRRRLALQYPNVTGTPLAFVDRYEGAGTQSYHGLLVSVQRRAAAGLNVGGNYTWSHCYGDASRADSGGTPGLTYLDANNRDFDRGNCDGDRRHIFNLTAVAETPQFSNPTIRALVSGWRLSGIYRKISGNWLTVTSGQDRELSGVQNQRAQQVLENPYGDKSLTQYLNPAAFTLPAIGTLGNMSPRNIEGPGTWQFDVALSRIFRFRESQRLEFRAEAYNLTNSLRPGDPTTNLNSSNFGQITTSGDPRIMQFALKYVF